MSKQIKTDVEVAYKKRNKTTVFWRGILIFPVAVFIGSFAINSNSGFAAGFIVIPALLALLFREVYPSYLLTFNHALLELQTRVVAYALLLTDDYPSRWKDSQSLAPIGQVVPCYPSHCCWIDLLGHCSRYDIYCLDHDVVNWQLSKVGRQVRFRNDALLE
jgi:hypothetical protein